MEISATWLAPLGLLRGRMTCSTVPHPGLKEGALTCRLHFPWLRCPVTPVGMDTGWLPRAGPAEALGKPRTESERFMVEPLGYACPRVLAIVVVG